MGDGARGRGGDWAESRDQELSCQRACLLNITWSPRRWFAHSPRRPLAASPSPTPVLFLIPVVHPLLEQRYLVRRPRATARRRRHPPIRNRIVNLIRV